MEDADLTGRIIGCAMGVHSTLGPGFLESVYQNALAHDLRKAGVALECQRKIQVIYDGVVVGDFIADMFVENTVLIENKAVRSLIPAHEVQSDVEAKIETEFNRMIESALAGSTPCLN